MENGPAICLWPVVWKSCQESHPHPVSPHPQFQTSLVPGHRVCAGIIRDQIHANVPRRILGSLSHHVHVYVDASLGGALYNSSGCILAFFSEELDKEFLDLVKVEKGQTNVIQEMEMLALLKSGAPFGTATEWLLLPTVKL